MEDLVVVVVEGVDQAVEELVGGLVDVTVDVVDLVVVERVDATAVEELVRDVDVTKAVVVVDVTVEATVVDVLEARVVVDVVGLLVEVELSTLLVELVEEVVRRGLLVRRVATTVLEASVVELVEAVDRGTLLDDAGVTAAAVDDDDVVGLVGLGVLVES